MNLGGFNKVNKLKDEWRNLSIKIGHEESHIVMKDIYRE
jgi:hypothetical protein